MKDSYLSKEEAEEYARNPPDLQPSKEDLKRAEDLIHTYYTFVDEEGWPVHIAENDYTPKT
jgi:hypothetical protein